MLLRIIDFCSRNRALTLLMVAAALVSGWQSMKNIPIDAIPDLSDTQVIIYSKWNVSPDIIEGSAQDRTFKILFDGNQVCNNRKVHKGHSGLT